jgi:hypothetical protein
VCIYIYIHRTGNIYICTEEVICIYKTLHIYIYRKDMYIYRTGNLCNIYYLFCIYIHTEQAIYICRTGNMYYIDYLFYKTLRFLNRAL